MSQLSLYLEDSEMEMLRQDAKREGLSLSRYTAALIRAHRGNAKWPVGYWEEVYGCLQDDSFTIYTSDLDTSLDDAADWFN